MVLDFKQIYSDAWAVFKKNWWEYVVVTIIMGIFSIIPFIGGFLQLFMYFLVLNAILKSVKGEQISFSSFFNFKEITNQKVMVIFVAVALIGLVMQSAATDTTAAVILSLVVLVLSIFFFPLFCVMLDKDFSIKDTITKSLQLTQGARIAILVIMILNFIIGLIGVVLLLIGVLVAIPIIAISTVLVYRSLEKLQNNF